MTGTQTRARVLARPSWLLLGAIFALCVSAWGIIEYADACEYDGMLRSYFSEYAGGGSWAWRGPYGRFFHGLLFGLGLPTYPLGIVGICLSVWLGVSSRRWSDRIAAFLMMAVFLLILWRFVSMGVASGAGRGL